MCEKKVNTVGLDVGTMNLVSAKVGEDNKVAVKNMRNVFIEIDDGTYDVSGLSHTKIYDTIYILGEDAHNMAGIFNRPVRRPMKDGMISPDDLDAMDVISTMVKSLIGEPEKPGESRCIYSIPANPIDVEGNVLYHEQIFQRIISDIGFKAEPLNEAMAVIYTECASTNFTGIGISYGSGMTNVAVAFKSIPVLTFSIGRGGDWIDKQTEGSTGTLSNRVTILKEKENFDINNPRLPGRSRRIQRENMVREGLSFYYKNHINYTLSTIQSKLDDIDTDFPDELPIIISGGTSLAKGFIEMVKDQLEDYEFPFDVSEVRHAKDPLSAVAQGNLIKGLKDSK